MAGVNLDGVMPLLGTNAVGVVPIVVSFVTNSSSAPDTTLFRGNKLTSVSRTDTGNFDVTLNTAVKQVVGSWAFVEDAATPDGAFATTRIATESADPLVITVNVWKETAGTAAEADTTSRRVTVVVWAKMSSGA